MSDAQQKNNISSFVHMQRSYRIQRLTDPHLSSAHTSLALTCGPEHITSEGRMSLEALQHIGFLTQCINIYVIQTNIGICMDLFMLLLIFLGF